MDIKRVVKEHGYTYDMIAEQMGINRTSLSQSLNKNPTLKRLQEVADIIGCDISEFFIPSPSASTEHRGVVVKCPHCGKDIEISVSEV